MPVTNRTIRFAIESPGGIMYDWRDDRAKEIVQRARITSPTNNPLNARHRGGKVGRYKASWRWERRGANVAGALGAVIRNRAPYSAYVEWGRTMSTEYQRFSWTKWKGQIRYIGRPPDFLFRDLPRARGRRGKMLGARLEAWYADPRGTTPWGGRKTKARPGKNIMRNAINYVMVPWGFTRLA